MSVKEDILKALKKECNNNRLTLPRDIDFAFVKETLVINLKKEALGFEYKDSNGRSHHVNMQADLAAFEGWAIVVKASWNKDCDYKV